MRVDSEPTKTIGLRDEFRVALSKRFRALRSAVRKTAGYTFDALQLSEGDSGLLFAAADDITPARQFAFSTDQEAQDAFNDWLDTQIDRGILESTNRTAIRNGEHYTARYVRSGYSRGVEYADAQLNAEGIQVPEEDLQAVFNRGIHEDKLQDLYTRSFDNLEDITQDMQTGIRRELSDGFSRGHNPQKVARNLTDRVDKIGVRRAERLARTEILHSHNSGAASRYQEHGISEVDVLTYDPCPICQSLAAQNPHPIEDAPLVPENTHPNCVCSIAPRV